MDQTVDKVWEQLETAIEDLPTLYESWKVKKDGLGIIEAWRLSKPIRARLMLIFEAIGEEFPALPNKGEREELGKAVAKKAWEKTGKDIPLVDDDWLIDKLIDVAVAAWRAQRSMRGEA